jgi:hypothetical protein
MCGQASLNHGTSIERVGLGEKSNGLRKGGGGGLPSSQSHYSKKDLSKELQGPTK